LRAGLQVSRPVSLHRVWTVAGLVQAVSDALGARFSTCAVRGEISGLTRAASGHAYFVLKDERGQASLRCAMFRRALAQTAVPLRDGQVVQALGNLSVYESRGELQFVVEALEHAGAGALYEQFLRLKARLEAEGLFDAARKRAVTPWPRRLAVVTSLAAAALHDVLTALARRAPHVAVVVVPTPVQGADAPPQIAEALARAGRLDVETVLLCRGGGSLEDLWAFNDERVVRAVAACPRPVVVGVGHETDVTLADFAADLRAPTPTAAAELAALARSDALAGLQALQGRLQQRVQQRLDAAAQRVDRLGLRLARPAQALAPQRRQLDRLQHRLATAARLRLVHAAHRLARCQQLLGACPPRQAAAVHRRLDGLAGRLHALDPARVLERGYVLLTDGADGRPLSTAAALQPGQTVTARLADGVADLRVQDVRR
jgi:exodeoxyribonuclease VII large subunit